jgi:serine/threonine protein kinase
LEIPFSDLSLGRKLGSGGFGDVYEAVWLSRAHRVAVKLLKYSEFSARIRQEFFDELTLMQSLHYDHIVTLYGACTGPDRWCLVMELMPRGGLFEVLSSAIELPWNTRIRMALEAAKAINLLHLLTPPMLHRDVKVCDRFVEANETERDREIERE